MRGRGDIFFDHALVPEHILPFRRFRGREVYSCEASDRRVSVVSRITKVRKRRLISLSDS